MVHPTSSFRVEFRIEGEGEERKLISNLFIFHNPIFEGRNTSPYFFHVAFHVSVLLHMYVHVCVEQFCEGLKPVFLNVFPLCFVLNFKGTIWAYWHYSPQIGQKWPCTGEGLQLDSNSVESLLRTRRGREGRVLWAPTRQQKPCFEFWNLRN